MECHISTNVAGADSGMRQEQSPAQGWFTDIKPPRASAVARHESGGWRKSIHPIAPKQLAWPWSVVTSWPGNSSTPAWAPAAARWGWWLTVL